MAEKIPCGLFDDHLRCNTVPNLVTAVHEGAVCTFGDHHAVKDAVTHAHAPAQGCDAYQYLAVQGDLSRMDIHTVGDQLVFQVAVRGDLQSVAIEVSPLVDLGDVCFGKGR